MNQSTRLFLVHSPHLGVHVESADLAAWGSQPAMGRETNNHWVRISIENLYDYHPNRIQISGFSCEICECSIEPTPGLKDLLRVKNNDSIES
jgi:hypothetical protein